MKKFKLTVKQVKQILSADTKKYLKRKGITLKQALVNYQSIALKSCNINLLDIEAYYKRHIEDEKERRHFNSL